MKKNPGMRIKNCKKRGEWAELVFAMRAMQEGLPLGMPWGDSLGYDLTVEQANGRVVKVQVKSTISKDKGGYNCNLRTSRGRYKKNSFDFVAAFVIPTDAWFIIPAKLVWRKWNISLYPNLKHSKYGPYMEAWHLLRGEEPRPLRVARIQACADERFLPPPEEEDSQADCIAGRARQRALPRLVSRRSKLKRILIRYAGRLVLPGIMPIVTGERRLGGVAEACVRGENKGV